MKPIIVTLCLLTFLFTFSTQTFAVDFTVNLTTDQYDANIADNVCDIDLATEGEQCSLRAAVEQANALASNDRVYLYPPNNSTITLSHIINDDINITNNGTLVIYGPGAGLLIDGGIGEQRIFCINSATVTINGVTLTGGGAFSQDCNYGNGGAIFAYGGSLTLENVHVKSNNSAFSEFGGGVYFEGGTHLIRNSTFSFNTAGECGGFANYSGTLTVVNSTIAYNQTTSSGGQGGGGFCNNSGNTTMRNVTITGNHSNVFGGSFSNSGSLDFGNTIVAGNSASFGRPEINYQSGTITSMGGNLVGDSPGDSNNTGNLISYHPADIRDVDPKLGGLQFSGGATPTIPLLTGSPAIDKGLNSLGLEFTDQRGIWRTEDGDGDGTEIVDIGAFELFNVFPRYQCSSSYGVTFCAAY